VFAGDVGLALYNPRPPELRLERVLNLITNRSDDGEEPVVLTVGQDAFRVDLRTLAPTLPAGKLAYRYRLDGYDENWRLMPAGQVGGKQASLSYAGLEGGVYTFTVAARSDALDHSAEESFTLMVLSRPPDVVLESVRVGERPAARSSPWNVYIGQPVQIRLGGTDDQGRSLTYRYRIEGSSPGWTETQRSEVSFTLSAAGTYTFTALAVDGEGQSSPVVGSQIIVRDRDQPASSTGLPIGAIAGGMGVLAIILIGSAVLLMIRRRQRESW
jgi:hypothetical protein